MKYFLFLVVLSMSLLFFSCQQTKLETSFTDEQKATVVSEVTEQFNQLIEQLNQNDILKWSDFYSNESFISAIAGTDLFSTKKDYVGSITKYFEERKRQNIKPEIMKITALYPDMALLTSENIVEMLMLDDQNLKFTHSFSMIWKKEQSAWKIVHSHESWQEMTEN